jgi:YVTN family beta-propeller protein
MFVVRLAAVVCLVTAVTRAATFGTVVSNGSAFADIVLDEPRARLYLVNTALSRVDVYNTRTRQFMSPVPVGAQPLSAAISRDGRLLYVAAYDASALNIINLDNLSEVPARVNLPAKPEGVAVGGDNRVLISTIGAGQNNLSNVLLIYDPAASDSRSLTSVVVTPPPPVPPLAPQQTGGRVTLANRSYLMASGNGNFIIGVNIPNNNSRAVFVFEVASGTVLRSRVVNNVSSVLSVSHDGAKFMAGLTLFETATLQVLAQQNAANSPWPFPQGVNFNLQQNQGGSVFSPDASVLYSAFNTAPVQTPAARPNVSQLMLNDPDNLLIRLGLQMPENLTGKMGITSDGGTIFALSESGFLSIPVGAASQSPIAVPERAVSLLLNDQCGAFGDARTRSVEVRNAGRGRMTVTAQVLQTTPAGPGGIGGVGGPGGGLPGGGAIIIVPPIVLPPGTTLPTPPTLPGGATTPGNAAIAATAPTIRTQNTPDGSRVELTFTTAASARNPGTVSPSHTILVQSSEAINIPPALRAFQNFRDAESRGEIVPIEVGLSANEALEDLVLDGARQRLYIANSGLNRVEVYDYGRRELLPPIKVGQLPRSLAMAPDGSALYVANTGGESVSIINPDTLQVSGRVKFPPLPFNSAAVPMTPLHIAVSQRGPQIMMNDGRRPPLEGSRRRGRSAPRQRDHRNGRHSGSGEVDGGDSEW